MKRSLEKLIEATTQAARAWEDAARSTSRLRVDGLRPAFVAHRFSCAITELEELFAVHRALWPEDRAWRERQGEPIGERLKLRANLMEIGEEVAEEERPDPMLAQSRNVADLYEFFCQVRKSILFESGSIGSLHSGQDGRATIEVAMKSIRRLDLSRRLALERALSGLIGNSFFHSSARLPSGALLGERYWPLFRAAQLLRGETHMNRENIREILDKANIGPETRHLVERLIDALQQTLSDYDIDQIRDILSSGGHLLPGMSDGGGMVVIPGDGSGRCAPIALAIAGGRDGRSRYGLPRVMREVRAYLIHCFEIAEVVILLTDVWDPKLMKESEGDFIAHASRPSGRKVLIPMVCWKRQLTPHDWP
jgi:hypothetical protein